MMDPIIDTDRFRFRIDLRDNREGADDFDAVAHLERSQITGDIRLVIDGHAYNCSEPADLALPLWRALNRGLILAEKRNGL